MPSSTLTSKGQVTIPKTIRDRLELHEGDTLEFSLDEAGRIVVRLEKTMGGICGVLKEFAPGKPVSVEAMKEAIRERAARSASGDR